MRKPAEDKVQIPAWIKDGSWQPWYLKFIKLIRRNLCILLLSVPLFSQGLAVHVFLAIPFAVLFDYFLTKVSWISNTCPEKIFLAQTTQKRDHVHENALERFRKKYPSVTYITVGILIFLPSVASLALDLKLPNIFKFYFMVYLLTINCSFAFLTYSTRNPHIDPKLTPLEFVEKFRMSRLYSAATIGGLTLLIIVPMSFVGWALLFGAPGFNLMHVLMAIFCIYTVNFMYQAEYNISIQVIASYRGPGQGKIQ